MIPKSYSMYFQIIIDIKTKMEVGHQLDHHMSSLNKLVHEGKNIDNSLHRLDVSAMVWVDFEAPNYENNN